MIKRIRDFIRGTPRSKLLISEAKSLYRSERRALLLLLTLRRGYWRGTGAYDQDWREISDAVSKTLYMKASYVTMIGSIINAQTDYNMTLKQALKELSESRARINPDSFLEEMKFVP